MSNMIKTIIEFIQRCLGLRVESSAWPGPIDARADEVMSGLFPEERKRFQDGLEAEVIAIFADPDVERRVTYKRWSGTYNVHWTLYDKTIAKGCFLAVDRHAVVYISSFSDRTPHLDSMAWALLLAAARTVADAKVAKAIADSTSEEWHEAARRQLDEGEERQQSGVFRAITDLIQRCVDLLSRKKYSGEGLQPVIDEMKVPQAAPESMVSSGEGSLPFVDNLAAGYSEVEWDPAAVVMLAKPGVRRSAVCSAPKATDTLKAIWGDAGDNAGDRGSYEVVWTDDGKFVARGSFPANGGENAVLRVGTGLVFGPTAWASVHAAANLTAAELSKLEERMRLEEASLRAAQAAAKETRTKLFGDRE